MDVSFSVGFKLASLDFAIKIILQRLKFTKFIVSTTFFCILASDLQVDLRLPLPQLHAEQIRAVAGHQRGRPHG